MATAMTHADTTARPQAILALALALFAAVAFAQPVAVVTDVRGGATLGGAKAPVAMLSPLNAGERVGLAPGAAISVLYYSDGAQFDARGPGVMVVEAAGPRSDDGASVTARSARDAPKMRLAPTGLVQGAMVMRNLGLRIVAPEPQVLALRPTLAWTDSRTEAVYDAALIDRAGVRVFAVTTPERTVALPDSLSLRPGAAYAVEVTARVRGEAVQVARAEFVVTPDSLRIEARALAPSPNAEIAERVAYALWLDQNSLYDEARRWWAALAQARPDESALRARAGTP